MPSLKDMIFSPSKEKQVWSLAQISKPNISRSVIKIFSPSVGLDIHIQMIFLLLQRSNSPYKMLHIIPILTRDKQENNLYKCLYDIYFQISAALSPHRIRLSSGSFLNCNQHLIHPRYLIQQLIDFLQNKVCKLNYLRDCKFLFSFKTLQRTVGGRLTTPNPHAFAYLISFSDNTDEPLPALLCPAQSPPPPEKQKRRQNDRERHRPVGQQRPSRGGQRTAEEPDQDIHLGI